MKGFNKYTAIFFVNIYLCFCSGDPQPLVASVLPTLGPIATAIPGCQHNGKTYAPFQSFNPSPCEHCMCSGNGQVACAIADCFFTPCVDAVHDPTRCCPTCPNGENCKAPDGKIIKKGETYHPDARTTCSCPTQFGFGAPLAQCSMVGIPLLFTKPNPTYTIIP